MHRLSVCVLDSLNHTHRSLDVCGRAEHEEMIEY